MKLSIYDVQYVSLIMAEMQLLMYLRLMDLDLERRLTLLRFHARIREAQFETFGEIIFGVRDLRRRFSTQH